MKYNRAVMNTASVVVMGGLALVLLGAFSLFFAKYNQGIGTQEKVSLKKNDSSFQIPQSIVTELGIEEVVHTFLKEKVAVSSFGDERFCSFEVLGHQEAGSQLTLYLWTLCSELYVSDGQIKEGGGVSEPLVLILEKDGATYKVADHKEPELGSKYAESAQKLFPEEYYSKVLPDKVSPQEVNDRQKLLSSWVREQGKEFYGVQ